MYTLYPNFVLRQADGAMIPLSDEHPEYVAFTEWRDAGGQPDLPPAPTLEERAAVLLAGVDAHLNAAARAKRYDSIRAAALRAGYPGPFHEEGMAFATWMDSVYAKCYEVLAEVQAGDVEEPTLEQLLGMLPVLQLPE